MSEINDNLKLILEEKREKIIPKNIKAGIEIFDIVGTYEGSGINTSDATAVANDIVAGKTAYINGGKVEGTLASISDMTESTATQVYVPADDASTLYMDALSNDSGAISTDTTITIKADNELVADAIGLAPDMIRAGANILGIEGTYDSNPEDYNARFEAPAGVTSNLTAAKCIVSIESMNLDGITVTSNMFAGCESLKSLPDMDVSKVGQASTMFKNCYNLVYTPELNFNYVQSTSGMFDGCHSISYINLVSVGNRYHYFDNMFRNCYNLKQVPNVSYCNSESFSGMFANCYSLENIDLNNVRMNNSHSVSTDNMCYNCTNLKEFSNVHIEPYSYLYGSSTSNMFYNCTNLIKISNVNIISGTTMDNTFYNCTNLTTLENCRISIGNRANYMFKNCVNLVNAFENGNVSLTTQRYGVFNIFENCYKLKFNNGFVNVSAYCNNGSIYNTFLNCTNITSANITVSQNNTGGIYGMFYNCTNLTTANIFVTGGTVGNIFNNCPNFVSANVTLNGGTLFQTFYNCKNLQTVNINIGHRISTPNLFYGCDSLTSTQNITLNSSWNYFCATNHMFANCTNLKDVSNIQITNISNAINMFDNCTNLENFFDISIGGTYWASNMFRNCINLTNFNNVSIYGINIFDNMFRDCKSLKTVSGISMCQERVTRTYSMCNMFTNCTNLTDLQSFSFCWDYSGDNSFTPFGHYNDVLTGNILPLYNLTNFEGFINYGNFFWRTVGTANNARGDLDIVAAPNLSYQSLQNIMTNVANLYTVFNIAEGGTLNKPQLIRMSNQQYEKVTEADIASLQSKGWNIVVHNLTLI